MKPSQTLLSVLIVLFFLTSIACPETIILKGDRRIVGELLKSDEKFVVVDLGCAVLRIPRSEIVRIDKPQEESLQDGSAAEKTDRQAVQEDAAWQLFRTAELEPTTIEDNVQRFGEAVVMVTSPGGQGSGFIISPDGYCITNYHVISGETRVKVTVFRRTETGYERKNYKKVKIIALNPFVDLALMKIDAEDETFKYAYLGQMDELEAGQEVFAIGNPLGLTRTVSQGILSIKNRNFQGRLYIQTTADINPGNSGGPLFNSRGQIIGVTSMGYIYLGGLNFAIPTDVVKRFIINRDAFAYDEDNPNSGYRYLQPAGRLNKDVPPTGQLPKINPVRQDKSKNN